MDMLTIIWLIFTTVGTFCWGLGLITEMELPQFPRTVSEAVCLLLFLLAAYSPFSIFIFGNTIEIERINTRIVQEEGVSYNVIRWVENDEVKSENFEKQLEMAYDGQKFDVVFTQKQFFIWKLPISRSFEEVKE